MADTLHKSGTPGNTQFLNTPAPWRAHRGAVLVGAGRHSRCLADVYSGAADNQLEADANVRLMAAAPELQAALLGLVDANHSGEPVRLARAMRPAVALLARLMGVVQ